MSSISGERVKSMPSVPLFDRWYVGSPPQRHHLPTVDDDGGAGDEAAGVGDEQKQRAVEIALLAEPAHGDLAFDRGALFAYEIIAIDVGHDPAGRDGVHTHALKGKLEPERLGELDDPSFCHGIGRRPFGDSEA